MTSPLHQKRAFVTGGSRGIGAAIVRRLGRDGANVAFTWVSRPEEAEKTVAAAKEFGGRVMAIRADSADPAALAAAVDRVAGEFGGLDILVNSAGVGTFVEVDAFALEDFDR